MPYHFPRVLFELEPIMALFTIDFGSLAGGFLGGALLHMGMMIREILCPPPPPPSYNDALRMLLEEQGEGYVEQVLNAALEKVLANNRKYVPFFEKQDLEEDSDDDAEPSDEEGEASDGEASEDEAGGGGGEKSEDTVTDEPPVLVETTASE